MISAMVEDVLAQTRLMIGKMKPLDADMVRGFSVPLVQFSETMAARIAELRRFLFAEVYTHPAINEKMAAAQQIAIGLYEYYSQRPEEIPGDGPAIAATGDQVVRQRRVGDFVAGMTDMFALQTHARLFGAPAF